LVLLQDEDLTEENQLSSLPSSPHSSISKKNEELECRIELSGRPSPVSVLDTSFSDDDSAHSTCQPGKHSCSTASQGIYGYVLSS